MATGTYAVAVSIGGVTINKTIQRTGDHPNAYSAIPLPAGKAGTLSTRTDNNTGVATLSGGHGLATLDVVDVFWSGGARYGMDCTVATNDVTIDGGAGDNLPAEDTAVVLTKQVTINTQIDGDAAQLIAVLLESTNSASTEAGSIDFQDASHASIEQIDLVANQPQVFDLEAGGTNPFTGNVITHAHATNGSSTDSGVTITILSLEDSTP